MTQIEDRTYNEYRAALEGAALYEEASAGRIVMRGRDRAALLHRLSTADIERLAPGQGTHTVLTSPIGRIIALVAVHAFDDRLLLISALNQGALVWAHLKKNIFFNDQVTLEAAGRSLGQLALYGPAAAGLLADLAGVQLGQLPMHHTATISLNGSQILVAARPPIGGPSFSLYPAADQLDEVRSALLQAGAVALGDGALEILRVEQGYGLAGRELSPEYIPLETGLLDAVSFTKGCYVGQEIIARMESRGRLAKILRGLKLQPNDEETAADLASIAVPAKLEVAGKEAGDLTSVVLSPRFGPIALAYVRSAYAEPGSMVTINHDTSAQVVALPFDDNTSYAARVAD